MKKSFFIFFLFFAFLVGAAAAAYSALWLFNNRPGLVCGAKCQNQANQDRRFFADELVIYGHTDVEEPFLLRVDLNRKKVGKEFQHYYFADFIFNDNSRRFYTSFLHPSPRPQPKDFLQNYTAQMASDLSARETVNLHFTEGSINISAEIPGLRGDFLVKNSLEYTKYVSQSKAKVTINGQAYPAQAALVKIYSADYAPYVFFEGYDTLKSLAQFYVLWDSENNFYLLDTSEVFQNLPAYKSHTWALYQDKDGFSKKAFSANVSVSQNNQAPVGFNLTIPDLKADISLNTEKFITNQKDSGLALGTVVKNGQTLNIGGYFLYHLYSQ